MDTPMLANQQRSTHINSVWTPNAVKKTCQVWLNDRNRSKDRESQRTLKLSADYVIIWPKQFKLWQLPTVVGSIVLLGVLTHCILLHSMCDLKPAQMNVQLSNSETYALQVRIEGATKTFVVQKVKAELITKQ